MSDIFDHEGDAYDSMLAADDIGESHYFSRYSRGSTQARQRRGYTEPANPPPVCDRCRKPGLKWRWTGQWVLSEQDNSAHACSVADDFDVLPDDCSDLV